MGWKNQVKASELKEPVNVGIFHNDGFGRDDAVKTAEVYCNRLDEAGIKFAAVDEGPPIYVKVEKADLQKVEKIQGGGIHDIR